MLLRILPLVALVSLIDAGSVNVCRSLGDCGSCADSYIHVFGFKENCRWCVETQTCGGPLACPMGKAVVQRDPYRCPKKYVPLKGRRYTDALGRSLFAVAVSLRADNTTECLHNSRPDISYVKKFTVECDSSGNICSSILAVSEEAKAIYVAYKGSSLDKQMLTEFVHSLAAQLGAWEKIEGDAGVITYFYTAWQRMFIEGGMKEELLALKKKHPGYRVWVTGHSLGGSLASITALHLAAKNIVDRQHLRLVTFGEPRTGNVAFAKAIEKHIDFRYRVVKRNDFVTNVPASIDPNAIMVTGSVYDRQPLFYRHLVHYNNNMDRNDAFKVCELSDDHGCRNLGAAIDINDHQSYFGISQDEYTKQNCRRQLLQ